jgi:glycosyltransferase involved in cell wall biosynthesis
MIAVIPVCTRNVDVQGDAVAALARSDIDACNVLPSRRYSEEITRMPTLNIATFASATVMGAQVYEEAIASRAREALDAVGTGWEVRRTIVRSTRSTLAGNRRLPMGWMSSASVHARMQVGRLIYPRGSLTHRMTVKLPASPYGDILTLHDVTPWTHPDELTAPRAAAVEVCRADAVVTVSEFSASEIERLFGVSAHVIPNGIDERMLSATPLDPSQRSALGLNGRYIVTAGGASERKNLKGLAAAWLRVAPQFPDTVLALVGPEHPRRTELFDGLPRVVLLGRVADDVLPGVFASASAVVVPSLYEGFGIPALEGMAVGAPVVASNTTSLPEVVGDGGILVEPSAEGLAAGIEFALSDSSEVAAVARRGRERAAEYTWDRAALRHARLWSTLGA